MYIAIQIAINALVCFNISGKSHPASELYLKILEIYDKIADNSSKLIILSSLIGGLTSIKGNSIQVEKLSYICFKLPKKAEQCVILLSLCHIF